MFAVLLKQKNVRHPLFIFQISAHKQYSLQASVAFPGVTKGITVAVPDSEAPFFR